MSQEIIYLKGRGGERQEVIRALQQRGYAVLMLRAFEEMLEWAAEKAPKAVLIDASSDDAEVAERIIELQTTLEEIIDDRLAEMLETLGLDEDDEEAKAPDIDDLARQVLPYIKRLIAVERERRA